MVESGIKHHNPNPIDHAIVGVAIVVDLTTIMCIDGCVLDFTTIMCIDGCVLVLKRIYTFICACIEV